MKKLLFFSLFVYLYCGNGYAQLTKNVDVDATTKVVESISSPQVNYEEISNQLKQAENLLKSQKVTAEELSSAVRFFANNRSKINEIKSLLEKEFNFVQKRVEALGTAPADGIAEPEAIAQKRMEFNHELDYYKSQLAEADILLAKIDELDNVVITVRNDKLLGNLLEKQAPIINPAVFWNDIELFADFGVDIIKSPVNWFDELNKEGQNFVKTNVVPVVIIFILCLWIGIYLRLFIMRHLGYRQDLEHVRFSRKLVAAICVAIGYGVIPACIVGGLLLWMVSTTFMTTGFFGLVLNAFLYFALYVILIRAVARVVFAPYNEKWRLVNVSTTKAISVTRALYSSIMLIGIISYLEYVATKGNYPLELLGFITAVSSGIKAFCIVWVVKRLLWEKDIENAIEEFENN
ncbi:MAG: hypothetical protein IJX20_04375 [Alphaproteobacteria bacterium]|nr:hypothetical protein [Alphaproteobacteria bacterium]